MTKTLLYCIYKTSHLWEDYEIEKNLEIFNHVYGQSSTYWTDLEFKNFIKIRLTDIWINSKAQHKWPNKQFQVMHHKYPPFLLAISANCPGLYFVMVALLTPRFWAPTSHGDLASERGSGTLVARAPPAFTSFVRVMCRTNCIDFANF